MRLRITQCLLLFDRQVADVGVTFVDVNGIVFVEFYPTLGWRTTMVGRFVPEWNWVAMFGIGVDDVQVSSFKGDRGQVRVLLIIRNTHTRSHAQGKPM